MEDSDIIEVVEVLQKRRGILNKFGHQGQDRRILNRKSDVSRSTVYRSIEELQAHDIIHEHEQEYKVTSFGKFVHDEFKRFIDYIEKIREVCDLMDQPVEGGLQKPFIRNSSIKHATVENPNRPLNYLTYFATFSGDFHIYTPYCTNDILESLSMIVDNVESVTLYSESNFDHGGVKSVCTDKDVNYHTIEGGPEYLVAYSGDWLNMVIVIVFDKIGRPTAVLFTNGKSSVDWALDVLNSG